MNYILPEQRTSAKAKQDPKFYKDTYDYYIDLAISLNNKDEVSLALKAANGIIDPKTFEYVLKPLGDKMDDLPGEIRNTDFITPIRERNLGEYIELPYKFFVKVNNPDSVLKQHIELKQEIEKLMQQEFINLLNENQVDTGVESKPVPDFEEFARKFKQQWFDKRATNGQHILNLINDETDFDNHRIQNFYYWWSTEEFYTYRYIRNGAIIKEVISPLEGYPIPNDSQFVEDYDGFIIDKKISWNQFLDKYSRDISTKDLNYVKALTESFTSTGALTTKALFLKTRFDDAFDKKWTNNDEEISFGDNNNEYDEWRIIFKTEVPINLLTYTNLLGETLTVEVEDDYELDLSNGDIEINKEWRQVVYLGIRIGDADRGIYLPPKEIDVQRYDKITKSCKLPIGGKQGLLQNIPRNPVPMRIISYLALDRIIYLQIERVMSKYKGNIQVIPKSMMNDDEAGTTREKFFYMYADNTLMYDDTLVDFNVVQQGFKVVNNSGLEKWLQVLIDLRQSNKAEAWELANMNNERYGATANSQTVTNAQQNIYRAKLGSTLMITMFNNALERDHMADLEFSKYAWINGKQGSYFDKTTNKPIFVDIDPRDHLETDYGLFTRNSKVEESKFEAYKQLAFNASQNGDFELASEAINAESTPELREFIDKFTTAKREFEQSQNDAKNKAITDAAKMAQDTAQRQIDSSEKIASEANETRIEVAYIQATSFNDESKLGNSYSDADFINMSKDARDNAKLNLAERTQLHRESMDEKKLEVSKRKLSQPKPVKK